MWDSQTEVHWQTTEGTQHYLFYKDICSPDWLRQQSTQLPTEQYKPGPSILVSRYFGTEESPHAANWAQKSRKLYSSPNMPKGGVGLNVRVPLGVFFFLHLLQTAAISDLVAAHNFAKEQQILWQIIFQIPLSTTGLQGWFLNIICSLQGVLLTRSQEQSCSSLWAHRQHWFTAH